MPRTLHPCRKGTPSYLMSIFKTLFIVFTLTYLISLHFFWMKDIALHSVFLPFCVVRLFVFIRPKNIRPSTYLKKRLQYSIGIYRLWLTSRFYLCKSKENTAKRNIPNVLIKQFVKSSTTKWQIGKFACKIFNFRKLRLLEDRGR